MTTGLALGAVGDIVEDVVVRLLEAVNVASDTDAVVRRRRGGSAANVVAAACRAGGRARFIGQVGDDPTTEWLLRDLTDAGVELAVRRAGRTGTIIVLVDVHGERTMLSDRGASTDLADPEPAWLDGLHTLHVPMYSLVGEPLATTTATLVEWAHARGLTVAVDVSSVALVQHLGVDEALARLVAQQPAMVLANEAEFAVFDARLSPGVLDGATVVVKQGAGPAIVLAPDAAPVEVPAEVIDGVRDTTGAGDAFAAGLLLALADGADTVDAVCHGHAVAAAQVRRVSA
jgi:sugar/nucleoside kinase (ribokinase family)